MIKNPGKCPPAIIHVALADMDATYGAYVAAKIMLLKKNNSVDRGL